MKITKKFLRETVLPYLKKYPKRYRPGVFAVRNNVAVMDEDMPKFDPAKPPPRGYKYDLEHLIIALHPDKEFHGDKAWNETYNFLTIIVRRCTPTYDETVRRLEEYVK